MSQTPASPPLIPGFSPDPTICRAGEDYYLALSSFEYFPGVPLYHSRTLKDWQQVGHVLTRPEQLPLDGAGISEGIFAPTLRFYDGWFYLITTNIAHGGNFLVKSRDPLGAWSDPVFIQEIQGIDPDLFWDVDGTAYLHWSVAGIPGEVTGIYQAKIDLDTGGLLGEPRLLWAGTGGTYPEGPHMFRRGDWYYLCIAEGGTDWGHMQTVARAPGIQGPWTPCPRNPVLTHRSLENPVQCVGHADLVETADGQWFGVCHGVQHLNYPSYHLLGREAHLFPVRWDAEGWPIFAEDGVLVGGMEIVPGVQSHPVKTYFEDRFEDDVFPLEWAWLRDPDPTKYQRGGPGLVLHGTEDAITSTGRPTWLGVRQRDHAFRVEAEMCDMKLSEGDEAGLVVYQNHRFHAVVGVRREGAQLYSFTRQQLGSVVEETPGEVLASSRHTLVIEGNREHYKLGWRDAQGQANFVCNAEARMYSVEAAGKFTGMMLGLYAQGACEVRCDRFVRQPIEG